MSYDDDADVSTSSAEYLESSHEAKRKALKEKLKKEGFGNVADKAGTDLKSLKLAVLKEKVGKKDDAAKADKPDAKPGSFGTKTREQEIAASKLTAGSKTSVEGLVQQGKQADKAQEDLQKQQEVGGEEA